MSSLCKEAALAPIRDFSGSLEQLKVEEVTRPNSPGIGVIESVTLVDDWRHYALTRRLTKTILQIRAITAEDMIAALNIVKASVSEKDLEAYADWNEKFGCCNNPTDE